MFRGIFTALITPFDSQGNIDEDALRRLVDFQIENGIHGLVPVGTTGESPTVSHEENMRVVEIVIDQAKGRVPVIAGTGSNCTREAIEMTQGAKQMGATASLQATPYYNRPNQEGLYQHFKTVADKVDLPMVVYNIQLRTGRNVDTPTLMRLAEHQNIVGVKDASLDMNQQLDVIEAKPEGFTMLSGDDSTFYMALCAGGDGVISVASNSHPAQMVNLWNLVESGDLKSARAYYAKLKPLFDALGSETNPTVIKYVMANKGFGAEKYRLPLVPLTAEQKSYVDAKLAELTV